MIEEDAEPEWLGFDDLEHDAGSHKLERIVANEELLPPLPLDVLERNMRLCPDWVQGDARYDGSTAMLPEDFYRYFPELGERAN